MAASVGCTTILGDPYYLLDPGGGGNGAAGSGGGAGGAELPRPDLGALTWTVENASNTPATISHDGRLATVPATGERVMVWSEPDDEMLSDQNIWSSRRSAGGEWTPDQLTDSTGVQFAFPSAAAFGEVVHAVFSGNKDDTRDVFYVRRAGAIWSEPANLTTGSKPAGTRLDDTPALAVGPAGQLAIAYLSALETASFESELRVLRFDDNGITGQPETSIAPGFCDDPAAVFDAAAQLHVVATCRDTEDEVFHASDAGGSWTSESLPLPACPGGGCTWQAGVVATASIAVGPDGTLHAAWPAWDDQVLCAGGVSSCDDIVYARSTGGSFSQPAVVVVATDDVREARPAIAVDAHGRVLIAYHRFDDPDAILQFTWSEDGVTFAPPVTIDAGAGDGDRWRPSSMQVDPATQLPELAFDRTFKGTEPLNTEIFRAYASE
jgi:hypothetical protein